MSAAGLGPAGIFEKEGRRNPPRTGKRRRKQVSERAVDEILRRFGCEPDERAKIDAELGFEADENASAAARRAADALDGVRVRIAYGRLLLVVYGAAAEPDPERAVAALAERLWRESSHVRELATLAHRWQVHAALLKDRQRRAGGENER